MTELISFILSQQPSDKPAFRINVSCLKINHFNSWSFCFWCHNMLCSSSHFNLFNLYNLLENPYSHFFVYIKALNLAINRKVAEHFLPYFKKIDSFLKEWNLGVKDLRGFFLKMSNILKETKGSAKTSFKFLIKYLETFSDEDAFALNEAKEKALHAIIAFVKAPYIFQIDDIEVESWVVKAISVKLLICKIDQMNQVIIVRCSFCGGRLLLSLPLLWLYKLTLVS
uniref:Cop9 complex subunit 7a n=1 Tax=Solanum tuberosum TaxID=4113 RepID=M1DEN2_SOLTU